MKKLYLVLFSLIFISIAGTAVLLAFTPDIVPMHYNFAGEVDRFGSKYEFLLMPAILIFMTSIFLYIARKERKKEKNNQNKSEKILILVSIYTVILFTALEFFFLNKAMHYNPSNQSTLNLDTLKFISISIGVFQVVLGNIMPKLRRNSFVGLRTRWSMANDEVWQKSQRFAGITSVIFGLLLIISSIFLSGMVNMIFMTILMMLWIVLCLIFSYRYYSKYNEKTNIS